MNLNFSRIYEDIPYIAQGILTTLQFTLLSVVFGFIWGTVLALFKTSPFKPLNWFGQVYTSIFRGTPLLLQIALVYFATPQLLVLNGKPLDITPLQAGVLTFTLNSGAYISETIRAGIQAVDKGQMEAALSLGIPYRLRMVDVILPQALKNILPALVNESTTLLLNSAQVSTIGVTDILRRATIVGAQKFIYFEPLLFAGLLYYLLAMSLAVGASFLERRLRASG